MYSQNIFCTDSCEVVQYTQTNYNYKLLVYMYASGHSVANRECAYMHILYLTNYSVHRQRNQAK